MRKRLTSSDTAALDQACETGLLLDGRIATQQRLASATGFSRQTICAHLCGRKLPLSNELKREGGLSSAHKRAIIRAQAIKGSSITRKVRP